jgi:hypothetical protein
MEPYQARIPNGLIMNPDYTLWYGWNEMVQDLREIQTMAAEMREKAKSG